MKRYRLYILDLDGTLYRGAEPVPHAVETVRALRRDGALIRFLTNNSGETRRFYVGKLTAMGYEAQAEEVFSTATGVTQLCRDQSIGRVFSVGEPGLIETLSEGGVTVVNAGPGSQATGCTAQEDPADAVIVGVCRSFTYALLEAAMQQLLRGSRFIATNTDNSYPLEGGRLQPGAGSMVAAVAVCSNREPELVVGKPNPLMVYQIAGAAAVEMRDMLCVGDRMETDILCGVNAGCDTHLVLTGVTDSAPEGQSWSADLRGLL